MYYRKNCKTPVLQLFLLSVAVFLSSHLMAQTNMYAVSPQNDSLWVIDTSTYVPISSAINVSVASGTVTGITGLSVRPCSGEIFIAYKKSGLTNQALGIVDPTTGVITEIGIMGNRIAGICFGSQNHLYAVSGDGGTPSETLYKVDIATAVLTLFVTYGGGDIGETIEFCNDDGNIYHWSGFTNPIMERTDTATGVTTVIPQTGYLNDEVSGVTYIGNGEFLTANLDQEFVIVDTSGFATVLATGTAPNSYKGLGLPYGSPIMTIVSQDISCNGFGNGSVSATIPGGIVSTATILISEVDPGSPDFIEITNVSNSAIDVTGMKVVVSNNYSTIGTINTTTWNLTGTMASGAVEYREDVTGTNYWGNNLFWSSGQNSWAIIIDSNGAIVDALFWGWDATSISTFSITVGTLTVTNNGDWIGAGIPAAVTATNSFSRTGAADINDLSDWSNIAKSKGTLNTGFLVPFPSTNIYNWSTGATTESIQNLSAGIYTVTITDFQGCSVTGVDTISEPSAMSLTASLDNHTVCVGTFNGGASTVTTGGTMPYSYSWSDGTTASSSTGLGLGWNIITVTDDSSCVAIDSVYIDEIDNVLPVVLTQNISVDLTPFGSINILATDVDNGSTDNCAILSYALDVSSFSCSDIGPHTVTLTVTDTKGNVNSATAVVTVNDVDAPTIFTNNISTKIGATGVAIANVNQANNSSYDNCQIDSIYLSQTIFDCSSLGNNQVWFYAADASGNVDSVQITVAVQDTTSPTIDCPNDTTFCESVYTFSTPVAWDNCTPSVNQVSAYTSGTVFSAGTYLIEYDVSDQSGNHGSCSYTVTSLPAPVLDLGPDGGYGTGSTINLIAGTDPTDTYLWNDGSTSSTSNFMVLGDTMVYVTVTGDNGCRSSDTLNINVLLGVTNGIQNTANVKVYPNPANDQFNVTITGWVAAELNVSVFSIDGKLIEYQLMENVVTKQSVQFNSSKLSSGVYLIRVSDGTNSTMSKIIVN